MQPSDVIFVVRDTHTKSQREAIQCLARKFVQVYWCWPQPGCLGYCNQVSVRLRDLTQAGKLLENALAAGAYNVTVEVQVIFDIIQ